MARLRFLARPARRRLELREDGRDIGRRGGLQFFLVELDELCQHAMHRDAAIADGREQVFFARDVHLFGDLLQAAFLQEVMRVIAEVLRFFFEVFEAARDVFFALLFLEP